MSRTLSIKTGEKRHYETFDNFTKAVSTVVITGCGGGNMGGNAAGDPLELEQQIEEPQMMADQDMNINRIWSKH